MIAVAHVYQEHGGAPHARAVAAAVLAAAADQADAVNVPAKAEAALAQPEPTGLPPGYIDPEHTGADRHLLQVFYRACLSEGGTADEIHLRGIRAVLADAALAQPEPEGLTEKQVMDLADDCAFDRQEISGFDGGRTFHGYGWECTDEQLVTFATELLTRYARLTIEPVSEVLTDEAIEELTWRHTCEIGDLGVGIAVEDAPAFIRAALARWAHPAIEPVPVSERLPGEGDCDAEGLCWWWSRDITAWCLCFAADGDSSEWTHWLPHWAIPQPQTGDVQP
jgi:hypothetical protein